MRRPLRSIILDAVDPPCPETVFKRVTEHDGDNTHTRSERWREGGVLHIKEVTTRISFGKYGPSTTVRTYECSRPCFIDFDEIMKGCSVKFDEWTRAPWEEDDTWGHARESVTEWYHRLNVECTQESADRFGKCRGYAHYGEPFRIHLNNSAAQEQRTAVFDYWQLRGASKQVAAEMTALWERHYIDQIVEWYVEGWSWYFAKCEIDVDEDAFESSCDGIDKYAHANDDWQETLASEVAYQMEGAGYIIINRPEPDRVADTSKRHKQNLQQQNWTD